MPFAGYPDFNACVIDNKDKRNPEAFCAWLEHEIEGKWPGEMTFGLPETIKEAFWESFETTHREGKNEEEAMNSAVKSVAALGWLKQRHGWARRADHSVNTTSIYGVPIFAVGEHNGEHYSLDDIGAMVDAFKELKGRLDPPVKIGHTSDEFNLALAEKMGIQPEFVEGEEGNGVMAFGWIDDLRIAGKILYADLVDVPIPIKDLIDSRSFRKVSAEIMFDFVDDGKVYPRVLSGLALLGGELPAVKDSGLETAAIYTQANKPDKSFEMKLDIESVTYEDVEPTLIKISETINSQMSGKPGVGIVRAMWKELQSKIKTLLDARKNSDSTAGNDSDKNNKEVDMNIEILKKLGLAETASDKDVLDAIAKLQEPEDGMPPEETPEEAPAEEPIAVIAAKLGLPEGATLEDVLARLDEMMGIMQNKDQNTHQFSNRIAKLEQDNSKLQKQVRLAYFKEVALNMPSVSGKPEEFAERMYKVEKTAGEEAVKSLLAEYKQSNDMLIKAGVFKANGTPQEGAVEEEHEFVKKMKAYQEEKECTEAEAQAEMRNQHPKLYREYMVSRRVVKS
jgi:hypothetical protein